MDEIDSNIPRTEETADQGEETKLDQDFAENEPSEEIASRRLELRRDSHLERTPRMLTRTSNSEAEIDFDYFGPPRVHLKPQEEIIPPNPHDEVRMSLTATTEQRGEDDQRPRQEAVD